MKILLNVYACDPHRGSEPGVGWMFLTQAARNHTVHAIVAKDEFEDSINRYLDEHPGTLKNVTFHFVKRTHWPLLRKIWPPSYYWSYRSWTKKVYLLAQELDKEHDFDLVQQVTLCGYREAGYLWKLGKPFIWGPIGGLNLTAWHLIPFMGLKGMIFFTFRNIINWWQKRWGYAARVVSENSNVILIQDPSELQFIEKKWGAREVHVMREIGVSDIRSKEDLLSHQQGTPLRICWGGGFSPGKALNILLLAVAQCQHPIEVHVLGDGKMASSWKKLAATLKIEHLIHFHGSVPRKDVLEQMRQSHVLCVTSLCEGGNSTVVLEGLQLGLPIVALDHCAFSSIINDSCGIKIPLGNRETIVTNFAKALDQLAQDEEYRQKLANGALTRSRDFTWEKTRLQLEEIYQSVAQQH